MARSSSLSESSDVDFSRNAEAPRARQRSDSPDSAKPLYITTRVPGETPRTSGSASNPSMPGIETSSSIRSGRSRAASSTAS